MSPATTNYTKFTGSFGPPKVIAQIYLYYTNGTSQVIPSDTQWRTTAGPITYSHVYGGEDYDARLLSDGWNQAGFNAVRLVGGGGHQWSRRHPARAISRGSAHRGHANVATHPDQRPFQPIPGL